MPLDGIFLSQLKNEIEPILLGGRVDKIHQPAKETIVIAMRAQASNYKLLISASASNPRLHFTELPQDNPKSPPMFCMLMRKHLSGAKLVALRQIGLDRILQFDFETANEFGDRVIMTLSVEIMGRHSNVILVDPNNKIVDSIKRINDEMSRVRPILPGISYTLAPSQGRLNIYTASPAAILARMRESGELPIAKALLQSLEGMSPLICRELEGQITHGSPMTVSQLNGETETRLKFYLAQLIDRLHERKTTPTMLVDASGKPSDFTFLDINQYGHTLVCRPFETFSTLLDSFYSERDRIDRMHQKGADLLRLLVNLSERISRKLTLQREELRASTEREALKIYGDLLSSNLYTLERGMKTAKVENYYEDGCPLVEIPLDVMLTPAQNAQHYYERYRKADTAERKLHAFLAQGEAEQQYFETVFDELARAATDAELAAIRSELAEQGYVRTAVKRGMKEQKLPPLRYLSEDGFVILCGRNNTQNDRLTLKDSRNGDIWFHAQKIPGSHVIVVTEGQEPPARTLEQAAQIAAYNSNARSSGKVAVDYTQVRNVKKHPANKPGLVIYDPFKTAIVESDGVIPARLAQNR